MIVGADITCPRVAVLQGTVFDRSFGVTEEEWPLAIPVLPFVSAFKGFGTGLTAAYLVDSLSFGGVGFYLLVLLPGTFLFCLALVRLSAQAVGLSLQMFLHTVGRADPERSLKSCAAGFCAKAVSALIMTFCAALLDTALWCLLSGLFEL